jgi:hypothetical protein
LDGSLAIFSSKEKLKVRKLYVVLALVALLAVAGALMAGSSSQGNPQGGYLIWHQAGGHGQAITVDQVGCQNHLASHPSDYEIAPDFEGSCGSVQ